MLRFERSNIFIFMEEQRKSALYQFTELASLRRIDVEFWNSLEANLKQTNFNTKVNLKPLVKLQKSINNTMMKMISKTADELQQQQQQQEEPAPSVDEVEGFEPQPQPQPPASQAY